MKPMDKKRTKTLKEDRIERRKKILAVLIPVIVLSSAAIFIFFVKDLRISLPHFSGNGENKSEFSSKETDPLKRESAVINPQVNFIAGDCRYRTSSAVNWERAFVGLKVSKGYLFKTGKSSIMDILVQDGSALRIKENSTISAEEMDSGTVSLKMPGGQFFGKLHKLYRGQDFRVKTPTAVVAVRGTEYSIDIDRNSATGYCIDGKVEVTSGNGSAFIGENQKTGKADGSGKVDVKAMTKGEIARIKKEIASISLKRMFLVGSMSSSTESIEGILVRSGRPIEVRELLFDSGRSELTAVMKSGIDRFIEGLKNEKKGYIQVTGYTDSTGTGEFNLMLSGRRAEGVRKYLISRGISAEKIKTMGLGRANPVSSNITTEGRHMNRRVELAVIYE